MLALCTRLELKTFIVNYLQIMFERVTDRRRFFGVAAGPLLLSVSAGNGRHPEQEGDLVLSPEGLLGGIRVEETPAPLENAAWYRGASVGDGLIYHFHQGALVRHDFLTADLLLDGDTMAAFLIQLQQGSHTTAFQLNFKLLNQCSARIRLNTSWVDQNRWRIDREGAWLKPLIYGDRVDLQQVDSMRFTIHRNGGLPVRWAMTDFLATSHAPRLKTLLLPRGPLLDELGQSRIHDWPEKTRSREEVSARLRKQWKSAKTQEWPREFSAWGGWKQRKFEEAGFFSKAREKDRWWLTDPDGYAFWSAGLDCVRVDTKANFESLEKALSWLPDRNGLYSAIYSENGTHINYLTANFIRTFGPEHWYQRWSEISLALLRRLGFNSVGNWSDWQIAQKSRFPYVRPMSFHPGRTPTVYRDFPDVFHPDYQRDAIDYAADLKATARDPAMIGYFLMNEPTWGFSSESPAAGMLFTTESCKSRERLAEFLRDRYVDQQALANAWRMEVTLDRIAGGRWNQSLTPTAIQDLEAFSSQMVDRFFGVLTEACRSVDPNHMNLGVRFHTVPPAWAMKGMRHFDVFSMNCYRENIPHEDIATIEEKLGIPVLIGEFHFGALDVGLPASGIGHVKTQGDRGRAYRCYVEDAAADRACVGTHWFTQYDQSALGRFDGENYNIGFQDVCNRIYEPLATAARKTHERLYQIASGRNAPYQDAPQYLPKLY